MRKKRVFIQGIKCILTGIIFIGGGVNSFGLDKKFTDVPETHWAHTYIQELVNDNYMTGYPDNYFRPAKIVSRAEIAVLMTKVAGIEPQKANKSSFKDVKTTDWYSPYIESGITFLNGFKNSDGTKEYRPNLPCKREDLAYAIVKLNGMEDTFFDESILDTIFKDSNAISKGVRKYVAIALEQNLICGYKDGTFKPQSSISRAEAAKVLWTAVNMGNDKKDSISSNADISSEKLSNPLSEKQQIQDQDQVQEQNQEQEQESTDVK